MTTLDPFTFMQEIAADLSQASIVFPTSFDTTIRLREIMNSDTSSAADLAAVVAKDPLLATKLVRAANSAALNPSGQSLTSIPAVVIKIGTNGVRTMALQLAMQQLRTYKHMLPYDKLCTAVLDHSRQIAAISFVLAREHTRMSADTALFAGLIHDIGVFYLVYRIAERQDLVLSDEELGHLLRDWHDSIGHAVLSVLGTPQEIVDSVSDHDEPRPVHSLRRLNDVIYGAHAVARRLDMPMLQTPWLREESDPSLIEDFESLLATASNNAETIALLQSSF